MNIIHKISIQKKSMEIINSVLDQYPNVSYAKLILFIESNKDRYVNETWEDVQMINRNSLLKKWNSKSVNISNLFTKEILLDLNRTVEIDQLV
jgi:hypothetical protein